MNPKPARIRNPELLESYHGKPCEICGKREGTVAHHIKTRGAMGDDVPENLMALCAHHHRLIHDMGRETFFRKFGLDDEG